MPVSFHECVQGLHGISKVNPVLVTSSMLGIMSQWLILDTVRGASVFDITGAQEYASSITKTWLE